MKKIIILVLGLAFFAPLTTSAHSEIFQMSPFQKIVTHIFTSADHLLALFGVVMLAMLLGKIHSKILRFTGTLAGFTGIAILIF